MLGQNAFLVGLTIGFTSSAIGAIVDYRVMQRKDTAEESHTPGCMLIMSGILGWVGIIVVGISLFLQSFNRALIVGTGVLLGFFAGFLVMLALWFILRRNKPE